MDEYGSRYAFIEVVDHVRPPGRHFGNKVRAFNAGLDRLRGVEFDFVGNLDADISLESPYFECLLREFAADSKLGIAGGMIHTTMGDRYVSQEVALDSVAGAVQLFRKECFEQIGGYRTLPNGGIDAAAEIAARMNGWTTRTFEHLMVKEHRRTGSATATPLSARLREGRRMHSLGYSPLFFSLRCIYRVREQPAVIGSVAALYGYLVSALSRMPLAMSPQEVQFLRREQRGKMRRLLRLRTN